MNAIITEGGLLPADILDAIAAGAVDGQRPEDFGMERTRTLSDRISTAWQAARAQWALFQTHLADLPPHDSTAAALTRDYWAIPLLRILGYTLERNRQAFVVAGRTYAISHRAGDADDAPPIHITGVRVSLDVRPPSPPRTPPRAEGTGGVRLSPHALVQEYLNATDHLWGIVTNGVRLRLLRESARFTRPTYVEFDLQAMLEGERFSDFALLYRLLHRSRLPQRAADAPECWLERYHQQALAQGGRVRDRLRDGVEQALKTLANGLLRHPANERLRRALASGDLTPQAFYRQVLRLVYRLLFLMVAEERALIAAAPPQSPPRAGGFGGVEGDADRALAIYHAHYSMARLRRLAEHAGVAASAGEGGYGDLWIGLLAAFRIFEGSVSHRFPIAPLDGDLFSETACPHLTAETRMANADLLAAIRALALYHDPESRTLRRVNYGALDVEELGSVYEALLDYRPVIAHAPAGSPDVRFDLIPGTERKTTGSYYTRPELVQELIASALEPVLAQRLASAGRDAAAREAALLSIRVCDPACGSGHFLLAAARRLGRELARIRAGDDEPSPAQFRHAVRDVIRRCIFGVDLNPLAVDLCKLALWIEGHAAGLPLSFLDHHIRCGNALVGATRALVAQGIPDEAYRPIHGDEKGIAAELRKRNRAERDAYTRDRAVQERMFADEPTDTPLARALAALDDLPDESVAAVRARAARYADLRRAHLRERARYDLWTAAFFQPLTRANAPWVPTSADVIDADPTSQKALLAGGLAQEIGFFHWELEFAQVFADRGGFDVVLGNPPWEMLNLIEREHFVDIPAIRDAPTGDARKKQIAAWRRGTPEQQRRIAQYDAALYRAEAESRFIHNSGRFSLTAVGRLNTYALFAELSRTLLAPDGRAGIIVPTGIATDDGAKAFFGDLIARQQIISLYDFENREKLFADVDSRYKFSLLTIGAAQAAPRFVFFATRVAHLRDERRVFSLTPTDLARINPNTRTAPLFRTRRDADLTAAIYARVPVLINETTGESPWGVTFRQGLFNMTSDSHLFRPVPAPAEARAGWGDHLPLYEAKLLHQFTHRWATYDGGAPREATAAELADPTWTITPRYLVPAAEVEARLAGRWERRWLLGWRDITNATNERTAIFSLLPRVGVGHTVPLMLFQTLRADLAACFLAVVNSLIFDWITRQKIGGTHLTYTYLTQLPVLPPEAFSAADIAFIVPRVVELVSTAWDVQPFAADVWAEADAGLRAAILAQHAENLRACAARTPPEIAAAVVAATADDAAPPPPFIWNDDRRARIRAELDARIARLYGVSRDDLRYILDPHDVEGPDFPGETFRVLKEKELRQYGEYRTRRLVLEAFSPSSPLPPSPARGQGGSVGRAEED
ncbi:Eco57I restriction-modification methylase domain-containing protein [Roseiflexus sp. RS-1]|uniref:Eco57I restriction-modification methylase domain-containing protein n=1 Tax=Roseiflexus sp. (strain RS-1) TaxID=357808 RepID=UPI0001533EA2|nr:DNA methyltransferase [Roseiflexus sp. RS-1]ABQ88885.1 hypothetical protein RoseRS_0460 [Roseiflexus sp. RS-1]